MTKENVKETVGKETKGGSKELLVGTLVGSVVGVTTALLVAPKSGKEFACFYSRRSESSTC